MPRPCQAVRLRYLWASQTVIAVGPRGEVLAAASVARLIVEAPRRNGLLPNNRYGYELAAIRDAVVAEAQLFGQPAPAGWAQRIHGKAIDSSKPRQELGVDPGASELPAPGCLEDPADG